MINSSSYPYTFWLLVTVLLASRGLAQDYLFYDIGNLGCDLSTSASGINSRGIVTGSSPVQGCAGSAHGFVWKNGLMLDLQPSYPGFEFFAGVAISENERILGYGNPDFAILYENGVAFPLPVPSQCDHNLIPYGISSNGAYAAGSCWRDLGLGHERAALYQINAGTSQVLPLPSGIPIYADAYSRGVNDAGVLVGLLIFDPNANHSFMFKDGVMSEIMNPTGEVGFSAYAINNKGIISGNANTPNGWVAVLYNPETEELTDLGIGTAFDLNERNQAVGHAIIDLSALHAMAYMNGEVIDLDDVLPSTWLNTFAEAINNYGWIVGYAEDIEHYFYGWLLVPIYPKGDYDGDDDVDLHDFGHFQECFAAEPYQGPEGGLHVGCSVFDFDDDGDLDLDDFAAFQAAFTGVITSGW